ncbi:MAG TPA: acyl-CoA dehydrogenase family protein [Acetobacteraceae bacterium]|nr:acyl-CoA dehydrogenase family protein [Acetobacteraceae bacterium]
MRSFLQNPPRPNNRFRTDRTLRLTLERLLPPEVFAATAPAFDRMGERAVAELPPLAWAAERNPPRHVPYDAWGKRVDRIETDPAWTRLIAIGQEEGLVALPYEAPYGMHSRVVQAGLMQLYDPVSAMASCPLTMTDGAAHVLGRHDPALAARYLPRLLARADGWTSGQWMTETAGGSDVGRTATVARPAADGAWTLHGTKWFTSATSGEIALALARPEGAEAGSRGLSLFLLELRRPDGSWNGITVRRLKDKLGTRALPTAELDLDGTVAVPVGGIGRGVGKIASLLNVARLWASWSGPAGVGHLLALARDYATRRDVFGDRLAARPIHRAWLARIAAEYEAMLALVFEAAAALGRAEQGGDGGLARLLAPLAKIAGARQGVWAASELVESFGGAGYIEDTGIPRVLRDVHVHCIWEGTTSVLAADVLRALADRALVEGYREAVTRRLAGLRLAETQALAAPIEAAMTTLAPLLAEPSEAEARRIAIGMARTLQAALLAEAAEWRLREREDATCLAAALLFTRESLVPAAAPEVSLDALALGTLPDASGGKS